MRASEILDLAARAGVGAGTRVLDLCCGVAGPGRLVTRTLGCDYLGVDRSPDALAVARRRRRPTCVPVRGRQRAAAAAGEFDVVLLLETILAFPDKDPLLRAVAAALPPGGRFALTVEEGEPLTAAERQVMPDADTVHLVPLPDLLAGLTGPGSRSPGRRTTARSTSRSWTPSPRPSSPTGTGSRPRSGTGSWTTSSRRTGSGATGCAAAGSGSSRSSRSGPARSPPGADPARRARDARRSPRAAVGARGGAGPRSRSPPAHRTLTARVCVVHPAAP